MTCANAVHPKKASDLICFTEEGIVICVNDEQFLNMRSLIKKKEESIETSTSDVHDSKTWDPIEEIGEGIVTCVFEEM